MQLLVLGAWLNSLALRVLDIQVVHSSTEGILLREKSMTVCDRYLGPRQDVIVLSCTQVEPFVPS